MEGCRAGAYPHVTMQRRDFLGASMAALSFSALSAPGLANRTASSPQDKPLARRITKNRLKQSVSRWCFGGFDLPTLGKHCVELGYSSIELLNVDELATVQQLGLTCAVVNGPGFYTPGWSALTKGWNRTEHHEHLIAEAKRLLPLVKAANCPNMIVFSGNRAGLSDAAGLENCAAGLKQITPLAESLGVTVVMELLNSKVDHHDYQCDRTPWGVELVKKVGSPRFKLLYDIYHMQIMEGDVIRTIRDHHAHIAHYHTAGVPGRNEIDDTQELFYPAICRTIVETGYTGYLGQEFIPKRDPLTSLGEAAAICDV